MSTEPPRQPTEAELRAAYEEEIKRIRVEHVLLENVVTLINLGMRRTGMVAGTEPERDPEQVRIAIESVRAVMPLVEEVAPEQAGQIRQALSQLQLAYVQIGGQGGAATTPGSTPAEPASGVAPESGPAPPGSDPDAPETTEPGRPGEPGPAQRSGRLWVPGQ